MEIRDGVNVVPECLKRLKADGNDVILYGAGYCGHEALSLMQQYGIPVRAVCDDFRAGEELDGYAIVRLDDVHPDDHTVIFITSGFNAKKPQSRWISRARNTMRFWVWRRRFRIILFSWCSSIIRWKISSVCSS